MAVSLYGRLALIRVPLQLEIDLGKFKSAVDSTGSLLYHLEGYTLDPIELDVMNINSSQLFLCSLLPDGIESLIEQIGQGLASGLQDNNAEHFVE